ncbi:MAG: hypothetical protein RJA61_243 [Candidatus Parcubacteria bacterium]|jgi:hypothetical protein
MWIAFWATLTLWCGGCQADVNLGLGGKFFYPDQVGEKKLGDPRKPMFEGSGYTERQTAGGEVKSVGFQKFEGGVK